MAKSEKLSKAQVKQLQSIGIVKCKDVEDGRQKMIEFLHSESIEDVEEDSFDELFEMASLMYDGSDAENNDLAEEVEEEDLEAEIEAEVEEEEVEEKPKKKGKAKTEKTPKAKTDKVKRTTKRLDPKNNPEDAKRYDELLEAVQALSPDDSFDFNFIANGGVTVKYLRENSKRAFFSFDSPKSKEGKILARVYFPVLKKEEDVKDIFGEDYEIKADWSGNHLVHDVELNELVTLMTADAEKFQAILTSLGKKDEKLGKNRQKMEDDLKQTKTEEVEKLKGKKKSGKAKKTEAVAEEVVEEAVEETVETPKPKKKAIKKPIKKSSKKKAATKK